MDALDVDALIASRPRDRDLSHSQIAWVNVACAALRSLAAAPPREPTEAMRDDMALIPVSADQQYTRSTPATPPRTTQGLSPDSASGSAGTPTDIAGLIARLEMVQAAYARAAERDHDMQIGNTDVSLQAKLFGETRAALEQQQREIERLTIARDVARDLIRCFMEEFDVLNLDDEAYDSIEKRARELWDVVKQRDTAESKAADLQRQLAELQQEWGGEPAWLAMKARATAAEAKAAALREWLDNNTTFYDVDADFDVEGRNIPALAQVSARIWYHATNDQTSYPFSAAIDAAMR
jgi:hypothetical protein